jgi:hypothetical protein
MEWPAEEPGLDDAQLRLNPVLIFAKPMNRLGRVETAEIYENLGKTAEGPWAGHREIVLVEVDQRRVVQIDGQLVGHERSDQGPG